MKNVLLLFFSICCIMCSFNTQIAYAELSDSIDLAGLAINAAIKEDDAVLYDKIMSDIEDKEIKASLVKHIEGRANITERYRGYMLKSVVLGVWCNNNIPLIGGLIHTGVTQFTLYLYEDALAENPENETIATFEELRSHFIDDTQEMFDAAIDGKFRNADTLGSARITAIMKNFESSNKCMDRIIERLGYDRSTHNIDLLRGTIVDSSILKKAM